MQGGPPEVTLNIVEHVIGIVSLKGVFFLLKFGLVDKTGFTIKVGLRGTDCFCSVYIHSWVLGLISFKWGFCLVLRHLHCLEPKFFFP